MEAQFSVSQFTKYLSEQIEWNKDLIKSKGKTTTVKIQSQIENKLLKRILHLLQTGEFMYCPCCRKLLR